MEREFEINGCIEVPNDVTADEFERLFFEFLESKGWYFGGGIKEIRDGYYVNPDGNRGDAVLGD